MPSHRRRSASGLRHRAIALLFAVTGAMVAGSHAGATELGFNFEVNYDGATVSGMFTGVDGGPDGSEPPDGILRYRELTSWMLFWSGDSGLDPFTHTLEGDPPATGLLAADGLVADDLMFWFDISALDLASFASCSSFSALSCVTPSVFRSSEDTPGFPGHPVFVAGGGVRFSTDISVRPKTVPEPTTLVLLGLALVGLALARHRTQ